MLHTMKIGFTSGTFCLYLFRVKIILQRNYPSLIKKYILLLLLTMAKYLQYDTGKEVVKNMIFKFNRNTKC